MRRLDRVLVRRIIALATVGLLSTATAATALEVDPSFDADGHVTVEFPRSPGGAAVVVPERGGGMFLAGSAGSEESSDAAFALARLGSDGGLVAAFGQGGRVLAPLRFQASAQAATLDRSRKLVVAGQDDRGNEGEGHAAQLVVARYLPAGTLDSTFGRAGTVRIPHFPLRKGRSVNDIAFSLLAQPDGKLVIAASADSDTGDLGALGTSIGIARLHRDGRLDTSFGRGGQVVLTLPGAKFTFPAGLVRLARGRLVIGAFGTFSDENKPRVQALLALTSRGSLDRAFGSRGRLSVSSRTMYVRDIAATGGGKVIVGGTGLSRDGTFVLMWVTANGRIDRGFGRDGRVEAAFPGASVDLTRLAIRSADGAIAAGGNDGLLDTSRFALALFRSDGGLDHSAGPGSLVDSPFAGESAHELASVAFAANGDVLAAGRCGKPARFCAARYRAAG